MLVLSFILQPNAYGHHHQLATDGKTKSGRPYRNEYIMIFTVDGDKIRSINEFVDSKYAIDVFNEEAARAALTARAEEACL